MTRAVNFPASVELHDQPEALRGIRAALLCPTIRPLMLAHRGPMQDDPLDCAARERTSPVCVLIIRAPAPGGAVS